MRSPGELNLFLESLNAQEDCVFCQRIAKGQYEQDSPWSVVFEPLNPVTPGHLLVVPKRHVRDATEAPHLTGKVMADAARIAPRQANIITSIGNIATQSVFHLHIHIVPRRNGDGLHLPWTGQKV